MSKVTLWSRDGRLLDRQVRPNALVEEAGLRRLDVEGIGSWLVETLAAHAGKPVEYLIPVGHGAGVAGLRDGALAFAPLDYEQAIPEGVMADYRRQRDAFSLTGSPALPDGLNFAAQLALLEARDPAALDGTTLLPWAQYWAWFLSGQAVSEVTSFGCHSDLWNPVQQGFAPMAVRRGWAARFAPLAAASDVIGSLRPELAARTGLPATTKVLAGLHDSNAALLAARGFAEIAENDATVLSTGTWFIALRSLGRDTSAQVDTAGVDMAALPEARDCLVNVDAYGRPVPSARFMGGREIETLIEFDTRRIDIKPDQEALLAAVPQVLAQGAMILPTLAPGCGPFPDAEPSWIAEPSDPFVRRAAASLYAALVADTSLDLIGARERLLVEGRFAEAQTFVRALAALRPETAVYTANAHNDVSFGALRLIDPNLRPQGSLERVEPLAGDLAAYRARWHAAIGS